MEVPRYKRIGEIKGSGNLVCEVKEGKGREKMMYLVGKERLGQMANI